MTKSSAFDRQFGLAMQRLTKRIARLQALVSGRATAKLVNVRATFVRAHARRAHTALVVRMKPLSLGQLGKGCRLKASFGATPKTPRTKKKKSP